MSWKKFFAAAAAAAIAASAVASIGVSAATTTITYRGMTTGAFGTRDNVATDPAYMRYNILNTFDGNNFQDIDSQYEVSDYIAVTFTIKGLDFSKGDSYYAVLNGAVGGYSRWDNAESSAEKVELDQNGTYTVKLSFPNPAISIDALVIDTNINVFDYNQRGNVSRSGVEMTIDEITSMEPEVTTTTTETTTTMAEATTTTTTIAVPIPSSSASAVDSNAINTQTGDGAVAAVVLGAVAAASLGVGAFTITRRKK